MEVKLPKKLTKEHESTEYLSGLIGVEIYDAREGHGLKYKIESMVAVQPWDIKDRSKGLQAVQYQTNMGGVNIPWLLCVELIEGGCAQTAQGYPMYTRNYLGDKWISDGSERR